MKPRFIYYLHWNNNKCFISDLPERSDLIDCLENENFQGYYGTSPGTEDMHSFQTALKVKIDLAVRSWFNDKKFLIHFLAATGIFLLSFYFLSYVIRDPLPLVDEVILSLVLALLGWYRLKNQEVRSEAALLKKQELIQSLNRIPFESADFLKQVELYLEKISAMKSSEWEASLEEGATPLFFSSYSQEMIDFRKALGRYLQVNTATFRKLLRKKGPSPSAPDFPELRLLHTQLTEYVKNKQ